MRSLILAMFVTALVGCAAPTGEDLSANEPQEATSEDSSASALEEATSDDSASSATEESLGTPVQEGGPGGPCIVIYVCGANSLQTWRYSKEACDPLCPGAPNGCFKSCKQYL